MPIREYACRNCGRQFEQLVRGGAEPECPDCHGQALERLISAFAVGSPAATSQSGTLCGTCGQVPGSCADD